MAYSRENYLKRVLDIQEKYLKHQSRGATNEWIFRNIIYPGYRISRATFYNYLAVNAKKELKEIKAKKMQENGNNHQ